MIRRKNGKIHSNDNLVLTELHQHHNGPYHLINVTLNIQGSRNPSLGGRGADFFLFSKYYCGSESTGYKTTESYDKGQTKLATAMAISGAAASPQMGTHTNFLVTLLMTIFNIRLNLWRPNPNLKVPPKVTLWPFYLYRELFRRGTENDALLNLSDGGHHENLGVYPLLKRRCRVIIASDATADPNYNMQDLANLQRKARIDLGINIVLDLKALRPEKKSRIENGYTKAYFVKGTIQYPDDEDGVLYFIKTTLRGDEPEDLLAFRRINPSFPDQTTADQIFTEEQFESYRKLGEIVGEDVCSESGVCEEIKEGGS